MSAILNETNEKMALLSSSIILTDFSRLRMRDCFFMFPYISRKYSYCSFFSGKMTNIVSDLIVQLQLLCAKIFGLYANIHRLSLVTPFVSVSHLILEC